MLMLGLYYLDSLIGSPIKYVLTTAFCAYLTTNHVLGCVSGALTAACIAYTIVRDELKKDNTSLPKTIGGAILSAPLSFLVGYGAPYVVVPFVGGLAILYCADELEVVWEENNKYIGLKWSSLDTKGDNGFMFQSKKTTKRDYMLEVLEKLKKTCGDEPAFAHTYSDEDYKKIPEEQFLRIWLDAANETDKRLRKALREADRADQATEVAKKVADLGIDADVQQDNIGQFIVYTGVSDPARRNEITTKALAVFEGGAVEEDNGGQFVIYTGIGGTEEKEEPAASEGDVFEADPDSPPTSPLVEIPTPAPDAEPAYSLRSRST